LDLFVKDRSAKEYSDGQIMNGSYVDRNHYSHHYCFLYRRETIKNQQ
jgi:hypothetical protein